MRLMTTLRRFILLQCCAVCAVSCTWLWVCSSLAAAQTPSAEKDGHKSQCLVAYSDAQELRIQGAMLRARDRLLVCSQSDCPGPIVHDCSEWLTEVDGNLSSVVFAVSDALGRDVSDTRVRANGRLLTEHTDGRALLLDPGSYTFAFEAPGFARVELTIAMRQSEKNRLLRVQLTALPGSLDLAAATSDTARAPDVRATSFRVPAGTVVLGATAAVGVAGFVYFGLSGRSKRLEAEHCNASCGSVIDSGKRAYIIADISLGVAVLAASAAILVAVLDHGAAPAEHAKQMQSGFALHADGLHLTF
jgi:hypothetical protein